MNSWRWSLEARNLFADENWLPLIITLGIVLATFWVVYKTA
jgi:hypothetical protein